MRPPCIPFDEALIAAAGDPDQVCIVPTAVVRSGSVPAALRLAHSYFGRLGIRVRHVELHRRGDARAPGVVDALASSPLTYLLGGDPGYLLDTIRDTPAWDAVAGALQAGGALAGSSAGAMVLAKTLLLRSPNPRPAARHGKEALGVIPGTVVIPHLNTFGPGWLEAARREAPGTDILGLDECTGVLHARGAWRVHGPGEACLWRGGAEPATGARDGQELDLREPAPDRPPAASRG